MAPPLVVTLVGGRNLPAADKGKCSDPYAKVTLMSKGKVVNGSSIGGKTKVITKSLEPTWGDSFPIGDAPTARRILLDALVSSRGGAPPGGKAELRIIVLDHDKVSGAARFGVGGWGDENVS